MDQGGALRAPQAGPASRSATGGPAAHAAHHGDPSGRACAGGRSAYKLRVIVAPVPDTMSTVGPQ